MSKRTSIEYSKDEDYARVEVLFYIPDIQTSFEPKSDCYCPSPEVESWTFLHMIPSAMNKFQPCSQKSCGNPR